LRPEVGALHSQNTMIEHCTFCGCPFWHDGQESLQAGLRIAFDPGRGRIWTVCDRCHGWSLWPLEDRRHGLYRLERAASRARLLYRTDNVALLDANGLDLIRVGRTDLPEEAWWRYSRELRRRRARYESRLSKVGAATYAAVSYIGGNLGLTGITGDLGQDDLYADVLRWRTFGRTAWSGRAPCPWCQSVLIRLLFFKSMSLVFLPGREHQLAVGMPCSRCDPWTIEKVHRFDGPAAESVLRRVLAYRNIEGATDKDLADAVHTIEAAGSAMHLVREMAAEPAPLYELGRTRCLALEISVNEAVERRQLALEGAAIEAAWRRAEELGAIIDEEL
jgi:hypothetical protein